MLQSISIPKYHVHFLPYSNPTNDTRHQTIIGLILKAKMRRDCNFLRIQLYLRCVLSYTHKHCIYTFQFIPEQYNFPWNLKWTTAMECEHIWLCVYVCVCVESINFVRFVGIHGTNQFIIIFFSLSCVCFGWIQIFAFYYLCILFCVRSVLIVAAIYDSNSNLDNHSIAQFTRNSSVWTDFFLSLFLSFSLESMICSQKFNIYLSFFVCVREIEMLR